MNAHYIDRVEKIMKDKVMRGGKCSRRKVKDRRDIYSEVRGDGGMLSFSLTLVVVLCIIFVVGRVLG